MRTLRRLFRAFLDTLPLHSNRKVAKAWGEGYFAALAVRRGKGGRFEPRRNDVPQADLFR